MSEKIKVRRAADRAIGLLFPLRCPVCDNIVTPYGEKICLDCMKKLKYVMPPRCFRCGKRLESGEEEYCTDCRRHTHIYESGRALYEYDSIAGSIYRFKYGGRREYADFYGEEIARYLGDFIKGTGAEALIPIPLHRKRQRKRGYNQAYLLAKSISRYTGIPVCDKILVRIKNTVPMKNCDASERQNNLKKAFHIRGNDVKLKIIILVDDIYTTGTTVDAAAAELKSAGAEKIYFIALACGSGV